MIGMVLVTHGQLATEFKAALEHVVGPQEQLETITIGPDDDMETRRKDIMAAVCRVNSGEGVVVLTDMFGGTPSNLALSCMNGSSVEVVGHHDPTSADRATGRVTAMMCLPAHCRGAAENGVNRAEIPR